VCLSKKLLLVIIVCKNDYSRKDIYRLSKEIMAQSDEKEREREEEYNTNDDHSDERQEKKINYIHVSNVYI
jgi:hypothetical protein